MTPQESQVLENFLTQLTQAQVNAKDADAQAKISAALAQQPDAAYLLVQRALLLEQALQQAKAQLAQLQSQRDAVGGGTAGSQAWSSSAGTAPAPTSAPQARPAPQTQAAPQTPAAPQAASTSGGWGSFLGTAASTAAGVAGGAFLFQGLEGLLGHRGGGFLGGSAPTETVENITINEYPGDAESSRFADDDDSDADDDSVDDDSDDADESSFDTDDDDTDAGGLDEDA